MSNPRQILFATGDTAEFEVIQRQIGDLDGPWQLRRTDSACATLEAANANPMDVIVADYDLPDLNGADLLDEIWKTQPKTIRFLRALTIDNDLMMRCVWGSHRLLQKPTDPDLLKSSILRGLELEVWLANKSIRSLVSRMRTFPIMPSLYSKVVKELESPTTSAGNIAEIISRDLAMTTKIIQVVNSAFYGLQRQITDLSEAINILGMETVKALILAIHAFSQMDKVKPLYFSIDRIWKHGMAVGTIARRIAQAESNDDSLAEEAFTAGLLHDIGKVILATNLDEHYNGAMSLARKRNIPPWEVESEVFGATHAETGAYLLALWGLPTGVVEATALHHHPGRSEKKEFTALTALHAANAIEQAQNPDKEGFIPSALDEAYLKEIGLLDHVDAWRDQGHSEFATRSISGTKITKSGETEFHARNAVWTSGWAQWAEQLKRLSGAQWATAASAVATLAVTCAVVVHFVSSSEADLEPASTPPAASAPAAENEKPSSSPTSAKAIAEASALAEKPAAKVAAAPAPEEKPKGAFPTLLLQGIVHHPPNSVAMINGQSVREGFQVAGARILSIERGRVRVEFGGEERVLSVK